MMEGLRCCLDGEAFDRAVHGEAEGPPVLQEGGDLAFYVKPNATAGGNPAVVVTFTVRQTDGSLARAQCVTTLALLKTVFGCIRGWEEGGHL